MAECVLKALNIKKTFVTGEVETPVLKGVDFTLDDGEFVAIVGESGSGKSTLCIFLPALTNRARVASSFWDKTFATLPTRKSRG